MPNIILASYRRSGTHVVIDTLVNNFGLKLCSIQTEQRNFDKLFSDYQQAVATNNSLLWTHVAKIDQLYTSNNTSQERKDFVRQAANYSKVIYVSRDIRDVAVSKCFLDLKRFDKQYAIKTMAECFSHNKEWFSYRTDKDILYLTFEELVKKYRAALSKISHFLSVPLPKEEKIVVASGHDDLKNKKASMFISSREFRNGVTGDYLNYFDDELNAAWRRITSEQD